MGQALGYVLGCIMAFNPPSCPLVGTAVIPASQMRKLMLKAVTQLGSEPSGI